MKLASLVITSIVLLVPLSNSARSGEPTLKSGKITFIIPEGDDKDDDTKVSIFVNAKFNKKFNLKLASLEGFGDQQTWEDDGKHSYDYDLKVSAIPISRVDDITMKMTWHPNGNDRCFFKYRLTLTFDDDDPKTDPLELTQDGEKTYEISEKIRELNLP